MDFEFEKGNPIGNWFYETCTIFRIGIVRLGVTQLVCCVISAGLGGVLMWLNQGNAWAGMGCWVSLVFLISGCWNLVNRRGRPRNKFSPCTIFNLISLLCAAFLFLYAAFLLDSVIINNERPFPQYRYNITTEPGPLIGVQSGLLIVSLLEFIASTWSASLSVGLICLCCQLQDSVFTIPYQDMDDGLPRGPDIVPGHSILDSDPSGPDIVPSYSPATPRAAAKRYQPPPPALELEWDNFVGGDVTSDLENSTGFGESGGTSVRYEDDYFGSSVDT